MSLPESGKRRSDPSDPRGDTDHGEINLGPVAGVCDRGLRHRSNDDAMSLAVAGNALIAVVCDGVSSTPGAGPAAAAAAAAACSVLSTAVTGQDPSGWVPGGRRGGAGDRDATWVPTAISHDMHVGAMLEKAMHSAAVAAQHAVTSVPVHDPQAAPSCTMVAAVVIDDVVTVGWIGDSRAYLVGAGVAARLTEDDTWAAEAARAGLIPESEVETDRRAHTLTRWLGADADDLTPHVRAVRTDRPARLVVCSDGLWNYASDPLAVAAVVGELPPDASPEKVARRLVAFAVERGGHDNITAVVADVPCLTYPD